MIKHLLFFVCILFCFSSEAQVIKAWDHSFGGSGSEKLYRILSLNDGSLLLAGYSSSGVSGNKTSSSYGACDYWIVKTDSNGSKLWEAAYGGINDDYLYDAIETSDGGYLLAGTSSSGVSGIKSQASWGFEDYWVVKIDSNGNYEWDRRFGSISSDVLTSVFLTHDGGFLLGGYSSGGISGDKTEGSWGGYDYWVVKIDFLGNYSWDKRFGSTSSDYQRGSFETPDHHFILAGNTTGGISGDKTQSSQGNEDYWAVKIDSVGTKIWDKRFGSNDYDRILGACSDAHNGVVIAGYTDGGISGDKTQASWGSSDYWLVRADSLGNKVWDQRFGGNENDEEPGTLVLSPDNGFILAATSYSDSSGNKTQDNLGVEQTWMLKCDANGSYVVDRTLLTTGHEEWGVAVETKYGCFLIGNATSANSGGDKTENSYGGSDFFLVKYCSAGMPLAELLPADTLLCVGDCVAFIDASSNYPSSWAWSFPGGSPSSSTQQNPTICYNTTGTYDIQLIVSNLSGNDTIQISGYMNVVPQVSMPTILQNGNILTCNAVVSSYQWYFNYVVIPGATNPSYTALQTGLYSVMVSNSYGCTAISSAFNFNVNVTIADFSVNDSSFCQGSCLNFTDLSSNTPISWSWQFPGATPSSSVLQHPSNICYTAPGLYPVTLTSFNQYGQSSLTQSSFINVLTTPPLPSITQNLDTLFCSVIGVFYQWSYNGSSIPGATSFFYVAALSGSYEVVITNTDGCTASSIINAQIPTTLFAAADPTICEKFCTTFFDQSTNYPVSWQWIFEEGSPPNSSDQNPLACFNIPGVFDITLITFNGIKYDTLFLDDYMMVYPTPPEPTITVNGDTLVSSPSYAYEWQLNGVTIPGATNQEYITTQPGVYTIITISADGCTAQISLALTGIQMLIAEEEFTIFPNPNDGLFTLLLNNRERFSNSEVQVRDVLGNLILSKTFFEFTVPGAGQIDLRWLPDGIYFIAVFSAQGVMASKWIKQ